MAFKDLVNKFLNVSDDEYDEEEGYEATDTREAESFTQSPTYNEYDELRTARSRRNSNDPNRVVDIRTTAMLQVVLVKPDKIEDAQGIADHLNCKRTVVLNLESASKDVAKRLVDFLNGVTYANQGTFKKVSANTFIITPYNVNISGDLIDELENTGVFF